MYKPTPIDTSTVTSPPELLPLVERLAEHVHDVWALQRIESGWTVGKERNDSLKTHPCLVPYSDLPESEKEVDRATVRGIVNALLKLGCQVRPPQPSHSFEHQSD